MTATPNWSGPLTEEAKEEKKNQRGSPANDLFRWLRKNGPKHYYGLDVDLELVDCFELVEKKPVPFIVARIDFKVAGKIKNDLTFAEALAYNVLVSMPLPYRIPVYIVEANPAFRRTEEMLEHRFNIDELVSADYRPSPPTDVRKRVASNLTWGESFIWEGQLRKERQAEMQSLKELEAVP